MKAELLWGKIWLEGIPNNPIFILLGELFLLFSHDSDIATGCVAEPAIELPQLKVGARRRPHNSVA